MEKRQNKHSKKSKDQNKSAEFVPQRNVTVIGIAGSDLSFFYEPLAKSVSQKLSDDDYAQMVCISQRDYYFAPKQVSEVTNTGVDISPALPLDVLYLLATYVHPRDCLHLLLVNKRCNQIFNEVSIWRSFCEQFGSKSDHSLTTIASYKGLLFTKQWTFSFIDYPFGIDRAFIKEKWNIKAISAEIYRRNYQYYRAIENSELVFFVVDMSKYDLRFSESDGTEVSYFDKCKSLLEEITTRPHGPITKQQYTTVNREMRHGLDNLHQPFFSPIVAVFAIGARDLENRLERGDEFPATFGAPSAASLSKYLNQYLFSDIPMTSKAPYLYYTHLNPTFQLVFELRRAFMNKLLSESYFY